MKTILKQAFVSALLFGAVLFSLSQVDWLAVFHLKEDIIEEKLGKFYWELFSQTEKFIEDETVMQSVDSLLAYICEANDIQEPIKLHVIQSSEVNAFAFPDRHLVIYTSLITECTSEKELCGVMAHEIAHIERGHVMQKLVKEIGLTILANAAGGDGGAVLKETAKLLTSSAYDRTLESEADSYAVTYLSKAGIDPAPLGDFLYRLAQEEDLPSIAEWISTHPDSKKRSSMIWEQAKQLKRTTDLDVEILGTEGFERVQERVRGRYPADVQSITQ